MRILILGGNGMLGHQLLRTLSSDHDVCATLRGDLACYAGNPLFRPDNTFCGVDASSTHRLVEIFNEFRPEAVVNCLGLVKQRSEADRIVANLEINALLPHRLAQICRLSGARLVHLSTDCVFSGKRGMYREDDRSDAEDLYGQTKYWG